MTIYYLKTRSSLCRQHVVECVIAVRAPLGLGVRRRRPALERPQADFFAIAPKAKALWERRTSRPAESAPVQTFGRACLRPEVPHCGAAWAAWRDYISSLPGAFQELWSPPTSAQTLGSGGATLGITAGGRLPGRIGEGTVSTCFKWFLSGPWSLSNWLAEVPMFTVISGEELVSGEGFEVELHLSKSNSGVISYLQGTKRTTLGRGLCGKSWRKHLVFRASSSGGGDLSRTGVGQGTHSE